MNSLPVFRDGTIRFDMSDIPITHFKPMEIGVPFEKLIELGYSNDIEGLPLNSNSQMLELFPQDFIAGRGAGEFFLRVSKYIDMLLEKYYGQPAFYKCEEINDLVGHLIIALAPHTSGGVLSRLVGWSQSSGGYAHPLFHASKRRNCFEGSTEINIIKNKKSNVISLKELIDSKISSEGLVSDDFGTMMCDAPSGFEIISLDTNSQTPITLPITKFIKGKTNLWIEIETSSGRKIKVTPDHQVLITKSGMMVNVKADEIKLGDEVLISSNNIVDIMHNISVDNNNLLIGKNQHTFNEIISNIEMIEVDNEETYCIDIDSGSSELISKNILLANGMYQIRCDGDEDAIMLLMDGLLNFSKSILPANRGGQMDAPLVLTTKLNPTEVDKEALNVDCAWYYPVSFYEATQKQPHPKEVAHLMDFVEKRLDSPRSRRGYGYTHDCISMDAGPSLSAYKTLESMVDKMNGQLELGRKLRAVDVRNVASSVVRSHFLPDLRGNLVAFTRQKIRCLKCGKSYRRMPLAGKCIDTGKGKSKGAERVGSGLGIKVDNNRQCGGKLALTVTEGAVRKYIKVTEHVMDTYGLDTYTKQNMEWLAKSVESLFNNDRARQASLFDFL
jgi:DNA polymerase II large subunit